MPYFKRKKIGKFWSIPRKGTAYLATPSHNKTNSIPLVVIMREILGLVKNKKELKKSLNEKQIKINGKEIKETNYPVSLFDIITIIPMKKNYRAVLSENKKMIFDEVSDAEAKTKVFKVLDKKLLPGKKIQLNLMHGRNIIYDKKIAIGSSVIFDFVDNKIVEIIPLEKGKEVFVIEGKHSGIKGKIENIMERGNKKLAKISAKGDKINVWVKNIIAVK